ncbi:MAG TPA: hypothetical protein EYP24_01720 [bacterium (Candidatus Stahlbacteria)]|nr:hypothetical protein [Candidatus Stahlbacteria bacterium]
MIRETIEFGVGLAISAIDLLAKRRKDFIQKAQEIEDRYPRVKRIADSLSECERRFADLLARRSPFASKEDIIKLTRKIESTLRRRK